MQRVWIVLILLSCAAVFLYSAESKAASKDLYKILGVDKNADQREIKKAFHKLSLKYHPDKNKAKDANQKFAEISNAYDILGDEEKRKQYDQLRDQPEGNPFQGQSGNFQDQGNYQYQGQDWSGFNPGGSGGNYRFYPGGQGQQQYTYHSGEGFSNFNPGGSGGNFRFYPGGQGQQQYTYHSEGPNGFRFDTSGFDFGGFGFNDFFKNSGGHPEYSQGVQELNPTKFKQQVFNSSDTWLLMFVPSSADGDEKTSVLEKFAKHMNGIIKVGSINCKTHKQLCKEQGVSVSKEPKLYISPWAPSSKRTLLEYTGEWNAKALESFAVDFLPKLSTKLSGDDYKELFEDYDDLPKIVLLTKKRDTPAMWRALSGAFHNRAVFFEKQVKDTSDSLARKFKVTNLPAVVAVLPNSDGVVLSQGAQSIKFDELKKLIEDLEAKNAGTRKKKPKVETRNGIIKLTKESSKECFRSPICVIAVSRTKKGEDKASKILQEVSQKDLHPTARSLSETVVSYGLLDGAKQASFLKAFGDSKLQKEDPVFVIYKPRKRRFATYTGPVTSASLESFISAALNGDLKFQEVKKEPSLT